MNITRQMVLVAAPGCRNADAAANALNAALPRFGITSRNAVLLTLAQLGHESELNPLTENLNYSASRLCAVWPNRFPTLASAAPYANNPEALGNKVYGGRMGNSQPGDGYRYRGRGYIQSTGRSEYVLAARDTGLDCVNNPDLLLQPKPCATVAAAYLRRNGCIPFLDAGNCDEVTRLINGGWNGREDRQKRFDRLRKAFPDQPSQRFILVDGGGKQIVWDGRSNPYGGQTLGSELLVALDSDYPLAGGPWQRGPLRVWRRQDGSFVLEKPRN